MAATSTVTVNNTNKINMCALTPKGTMQKPFKSVCINYTFKAHCYHTVTILHLNFQLNETRLQFCNKKQSAELMILWR